MIVSMPDDGVSRALVSHGSNGTDNHDSTKSGTQHAETHEPPTREAPGWSLGRLFNVTIDCVRGRYDR
jgi:hypothetical protein